AISKTNCVVIFINQLRDKIGVMFGNPETTTGGKALKYYASVRIDIRRMETLKVSGEMIGSRTRAKVVKNKVAPPFREGEFDIMYGEGISREGEIVDLGVKADIIQKSGAWFSYEGERLGQGRDNVKKLLKENPDLAAEIEQKIRNSSLVQDRRPGAASSAAPAPVMAETRPVDNAKVDIVVDDEV
ncbi:MAG: DNA recombination/repair protein RecA, partial [Clostridia bacterium]|nr:DNA recombination/repair protein RecA [Clostridia bacterium]